MFERFTEQARQVVVLAQEEARDLGHNYIGTEHVLLGLVREEDGIAAQVLASFGVTVERARGQILRIVGSGEEVTAGQIPFTPRAKKVLELALREALSLGHDYIGTEHILLGLVRENGGVAARMLLDFDADSETVRREVLRRLSAPAVTQHVSLLVTGPRRAPNPLRPPLDWERAGILWRPDRILRGTAREVERLALRVLEQQLGLRVSRTRPSSAPRSVAGPHRRPPQPPPGPGAHRITQPSQGLAWSAATLHWRPEGLELRVPLRLDEPAMAAFASDEAWKAPPLAGLRREIWSGWLALASPTLLDEVDPEALRGALEEAVARARGRAGAEPGPVEEFLRRLRG